ncbi:hypothetical protein [Amycolatopsis alkalitolerans]|uniref:Uncharacterized protein n=1 Tax=Amycolatopsis alkalitolerans TaxID=2547244 RepID=A0A5C4LUH9_9PSEU|nr:hypothetical protein [Amycolatopsis alkalitolerans]TNC21292.1 hypothetical protein FG385_28580 [Amycolatopsis alkalitolerans]
MSRNGLLVLLLVDTVLLATLELFFLPLRAGGTVPIPFTVLVAIVTTPLLVIQAGKLVHRKAAAAPLALWVLTIVVLGLTGPGGDLVLVQDWRGLLLIAGGALPAALALGGSLALPGRT